MSTHAAPHVVPFRIYLGVFLALLCLTVVTVAVSYVDFGSMNLVIAMAVASVKAALVALVFMHLKYEERFNAVVLVASVVFLAVFIGFSRLDSDTRGRADPVEAQRVRDLSQPFAKGPPRTR